MNAKQLQDILNGHGLLFRITDERIKQDTYLKTNDVVGVLEMMGGGYLYDQAGNRVISLQVEFKGANRHFGAFREIVDTYFPNDELIGDYWVYAQPLEFITFPENEGIKKFEARIMFQIVEVVGGVSGKSSHIKVDGVMVDFLRVLYRQDKSLLPTKAFGNNKDVRVVSELLTLKLPVSENVKNQELLLAAINDSYNVSYVVEWQIGGIIKTFDAVLRVGLMEYNNNHEPIMFDITFERALPREIWQVAVWETENFWDVDKEPKPYDESYDTIFASEGAFREFLDTIDRLDDVGYTVRSGQVEQTWTQLAGSPSSDPFLYTPDDYDVTVEQEDWEAFLKTYWGDIDEVGYIFAIEYEKSREWEFVGRTPDYTPDEPSVKLFDGGDWSNDIPSFMDFVEENFNPYEYSAGYLYYIQNDGDDEMYYVRCKATHEYVYYELTDIGENVYFGKVTAGGQYSSKMEAPVIDYSMKQSVDTTPRTINRRVIGDYKHYGTGFMVLFLINYTTQRFIDNLVVQRGEHYKITFYINGKEYEYSDLIITEIERQNTENANQVMQVTFAEGSIE